MFFPRRDTIYPARGQEPDGLPDDVDAAGSGIYCENHCAILSWAGFPAQPCKMGIKCPPLLLCSMSPPLQLGVFVMVIGRWQNSWIPLAPPSSIQTSDHISPICYPFLPLSLQIRDGSSCGNMKGSVQAASGISAILLPPTPTGALGLFPNMNYPNVLIVQINAHRPYI